MGRSDEGMPAEVREAAFRAQAPAGQPRFGVATLKNGDRAIWTVTEMAQGKFASIAQDARRSAHDEARDPQGDVRRDRLRHDHAGRCRRRRESAGVRIDFSPPRANGRSGTLARSAGT
jgi:hypothetical protein